MDVSPLMQFDTVAVGPAVRSLWNVNWIGLLLRWITPIGLFLMLCFHLKDCYTERQTEIKQQQLAKSVYQPHVQYPYW